MGVLLISLEKDELEFAVRYVFKTSNNEAEYEALIQGIKLADLVGAARLIFRSDS